MSRSDGLWTRMWRVDLLVFVSLVYDLMAVWLLLLLRESEGEK